MLCPMCSVDLVLSERQGIEIDYCPKCRGVWLDRGELDKIIERSGPALSQSPAVEHRSNYREQDSREYHPEHRSSHGHQKHKRKSFLEDIFDFD